jgi:hypothetical protein|tara:strand:- start:312 stop:503 length:192 start_codon:yes stop_codon:yes gene_type:complete
MKRKIIEFKIAKRNFYRGILQSMADGIIVKIEKSETDEDAQSWLNMGMQIDLLAWFSFNIHLK